MQIQIDPQKIGDVVGQRGKTINTIIERTGVKIDITDEGAVSVCGVDQHGMDEAKKMIRTIATDFEAGQIFEGTVIAKKHGGINETFTVRRVAHGCGIERVFPVHSPAVDKVEVVRHGKVRRAKLYYLRDRVGKASKVKEKSKTR